MVTNKKEKVIVNIQYPCYICANVYAGARQVINHVENMHGYILNPRQIGHHRPPSNHYDYENDIKKKWDVQHFGCPSCWFHCPKNFEILMEHIMIEHDPFKVEGFLPKNSEDEVEEYESEEGSEKDELEEESGEEQGGGKASSTDRGGGRSTSVSSTKKDDNQEKKTTSTASGSQKGAKDPVAAVVSSGSSVFKDLGQKDSSSSSAAPDDAEATRQGGGKGQSVMAEEIMNKLNDLNTMFKQLFKS